MGPTSGTLPAPAWTARRESRSNLYVASFNNGAIRKFSPNGTDLGSLVSGLPGPAGLAFDQAGDLYVANFFVNAIWKYSTQGANLGTYASSADFNGPTFIAFSAEPPGHLDESFGTLGLVTRNFGGAGAQVNSVQVDALGRVVAAGDFGIVRYTASGNPDTSFGSSGLVSAGYNVSAIALQGDGKIVACGSNQLSRYTDQGYPDSSFHGSVNLDFTADKVAVAIQNDGKIVVAGTNYSGIFLDQTVNTEMARFNSDGTPDSDFDYQGAAVPMGWFTAMALQADGRIVFTQIVAESNNDGGLFKTDASVLVRVNTNGSLDQSFLGGGVVQIPMQSGGVAIDAAGNIVVAGEDVGGSNALLAVSRYHPTGALDTSFGSQGEVLTDINNSDDDQKAFDIKIQQNGKILVAGYMDDGHNKSFALVRYNPNGSLDNTFAGYRNVPGVAVTDFFNTNDDDVAYAMALTGNGDIVLGGYTVDAGGPHQLALAHYIGDFTPNPKLAVEAPAGSPFSNGDSIDFGTILVGASPTRTFTLRNTGTSTLTISSVTASGQFSILNGAGTTYLAPGASTTVAVAFSPNSAPASSGLLQITSNDTTNGTFDIQLSGQGTNTLATTFNSDGDVGLSTDGLTLSAQSVALSLGFAPAPGTRLRVVDNTSSSPISGAFPTLPDGKLLVLTYGGVQYGFFTDYEGGDGNDLVLTCIGDLPDAAPFAVINSPNSAPTDGLAIFGTAARMGSFIPFGCDTPKLASAFLF